MHFKNKIVLSEFSNIRPFHDSEVSEVLTHVKDNETMLKLLPFAFPSLSEDERLERLLSCKKISDFQKRIMYPIILRAISRSVKIFSWEGFERLDPNKAYLFISNHRDIILDTSFLNFTLHNLGFKMTASAIGDNLVRKPFLLALAKLNRNFLIHRGLPPREMLEKSRIVSKFIHRYIAEKNRSVWIAQREGRTKDGNDYTQQGVLKMLSMNCPSEMSIMQYLKSLHIVPMAISYEFDPTDTMKIPALMAQHHGVEYIKSKDEDFKNIVMGFVGQKGRVHIAVGEPLNKELDAIETQYQHANKQIQAVAELLDRKIHQQYKLHPSNYIAYDILTQSASFEKQYSPKERRQFERRVAKRGFFEDKVAEQKYLEMYANPVRNKFRYK